MQSGGSEDVMAVDYQTKTVLIVDDEPDVVRMVSQHLASAGFQVTKASDGDEAIEIARKLHPSLVILDLNMPNTSGTDVLRAIKADARTSAISVVMLTARKDEVDRIVCLELGADDYVTKPFSPRELTLRVKSILSRRSAFSPTQNFSTCGSISLNREAHEVRVVGKVVDLTAVEYKLLVALFRQPGRVFTREDLLNAVWGQDAEIEVRTVDTHMRRLREKLGTGAAHILTVRGFGYRLDGE
jgi:two-component system, OmpR family, phosphate regulon response regulator PhoB